MLTHFQPASICCPARNITLYLQSNIRVTINAKKCENTKIMCISREYFVIHITYSVGKLIFNIEAVIIKIPICYQTSSTMGYLTSFRMTLYLFSYQKLGNVKIKIVCDSGHELENMTLVQFCLGLGRGGWGGGGGGVRAQF
jgi:hypothetical protein